MMAVMIAMALMNLYQNIVINLYVSVLSVIIIFNGVIALGIPSSMEDVILGSFSAYYHDDYRKCVALGGTVEKAKCKAGTCR